MGQKRLVKNQHILTISEIIIFSWAMPPKCDISVLESTLNLPTALQNRNINTEMHCSFLAKN